VGVWLENATQQLNNLKNTVAFLLHERDWMHEKAKQEEQAAGDTADVGVQVGGEHEHIKMVRDLEKEAFLKWSRLGQKQDDYYRQKEIALEAARNVMVEEEAVMDSMLEEMEEERAEHEQTMEEIRAELCTLMDEEKMRRSEMHRLGEEMETRRRNTMQLELLEDHLMDSILRTTHEMEDQVQKLNVLKDEEKLLRATIEELNDEMEIQQRKRTHLGLEEEALCKRLKWLEEAFVRKLGEEFRGEEGWASEYV
jgi:superfamily II DNA helicase RecQ